MLLSWLRRLFGGRPPGVPMVPYWDGPSKKIIRIPKAELAPGTIQVRLQGEQDLVWVLPEVLHQGDLRHPPFGEAIRVYIRRIQGAFSEHRPLSVEEWEDGFRRDANPEQEMGLWIYTAEIYEEFTRGEASAERRSGVYQVLVTCLTTSFDGALATLPTTALARVEAEVIVRRYFQKP